MRSTQWVAKDPSFLHTDSEDSDQTGLVLPCAISLFLKLGSVKTGTGQYNKEAYLSNDAAPLKTKEISNQIFDLKERRLLLGNRGKNYIHYKEIK